VSQCRRLRAESVSNSLRPVRMAVFVASWRAVALVRHHRASHPTVPRCSGSMVGIMPKA
jgi:hypothetical protein